MTFIKFNGLPIFLLVCTISQTIIMQARDDRHFNRGRGGRGYRSEGYRRGGYGYNGYWDDGADYAVPLAIGATAAAATAAATAGNANDAYQEGYSARRQDIRDNEREHLERENEVLRRQRSGNE